ncbi:MAG: hypothetical protein ACPLTR_09565 [Thermacetogeniaceae bacterium]
MVAPRKRHARKAACCGKIKIDYSALEVIMEHGMMIEQIMDFVGQHRESHAAKNIFRRILGVYPDKIDQGMLSELQKGLQQADPDEVEACYYIIT